jgi:hypothetical protein
MNIFIKNEVGVSLIVVVVILLIMGMMIAVFMSLINTESFTAMGQGSSLQSFGVAEGGVEFDQMRLAQDLFWYRSAADPVTTAATNLGSGSFTVNSNLPATLLRKRIPDLPSTAAITVYTTNRFPTSGYLMVGSIGLDPFEFIQYTGIAGNTFTGITRDRTIGPSGVNGEGNDHPRGEYVYPVTTLSGALVNSCTTPATFNIVAHTKFLTAGTIAVLNNWSPNPTDWEEISYSSSTVAGGVMTLNGVRRCQNGTVSAGHSAGDPVMPILADGTQPDYEDEIVSTGAVNTAVVGNAVRVVRKTVQR